MERATIDVSKLEVTIDTPDIEEFIKVALSPLKRRVQKIKNKCYCIFIQGELYITPAGKCVWARKNHATSAFTNHLKYATQDILRSKIAKQMGCDRNLLNNVWSNPTFKNGYDIILDKLKESGMFQLVEIDLKQSEE